MYDIDKNNVKVARFLLMLSLSHIFAGKLVIYREEVIVMMQMHGENQLKKQIK